MKRYVLSSGKVNRYGYRILPDGIELSNYQENPVILWSHNGEKVSVGKMTDLKVIDGQLTGVPEFDTEDPIGKELARKYEKGYLNAFSISHAPIEVSEDPALILSGQKRATVTKTDVLEISAVNVPGDAGAVGLSLGNNLPLDDIIPFLSAPKVKEQSISKNLENGNMKKIFEALGLSDSATEADAVKAVKALKTQLSASIVEQKNALIQKGMDAGVITDDTKSTYEALSYDDAKKVIDANILSFGKKQAKSEEPKQDQSLVEALTQLTAKSGTGATEDKETFEYLSKNNPDKLNNLRLENPEKYNQLVADYKKV